MAGNIKGITVEIGGDTTGLEKALKSVNSTIKTTSSELKDIERLLKLDPSNTELLSQKQETLKEKISATKEKLEALKSAQEQAKAQIICGNLMLIAEICIYPTATPADPAYKPVYPDIHSTGQREERTMDAKRELSLDDLDKVAGGVECQSLTDEAVRVGSLEHAQIDRGVCPLCYCSINRQNPICFSCKIRWILVG